MKAGFYIRVSTQRQGLQGTSMETQEERCRLKATQAGDDVDPAYIWKDTQSAATMERPALAQMRAAVRNREIDIVYVHVTDRLARDPVDTLIILREFLEAGVRLEFVEGPSDTSDEGQLLMFILGYGAKRERLNFIERSKRSKEKIAREGRWPDGNGPGLYGYDYDPVLKVRTVNEAEAAVVRMMFQWALEGRARNRIAAMLNEANIPTRKGKKWSANSVSRKLQNRAYTGVQYFGTRQTRKLKDGKQEITFRPKSETIRVVGFTPALITEEMFEAVQEKLNIPQARQTKMGPRNLLTGLVKCLTCGTSVVGSMKLNGLKYYRCNAAFNHTHKPATCHERNIRADWMEPLVWTMVSNAIKYPEILIREIMQHVESGTGNLEEETKKLRKEISKLKGQQYRLLEQRQKDFIDQEILERQISPVKLLCDEREKTLRSLEEQQAKKEDIVQAEERIKEYCERVAKKLDDADFDAKRSAMTAFGVNVEATRTELSVTMAVDPSATTILPTP